MSSLPQTNSLSLWSRTKETIDDFATAKPARFSVISFSSLIVLWTFLIALPTSSAAGTWTNLLDALFTAVSTICVTGLATVDMAYQWSISGQVIIFVGVQIGAMGVMTLASTLGLIFSRRLKLTSRLIAAAESNTARLRRGPIAESQAIRLGDIGGLLLTVATVMITIEVAIAVLMFPSMLAAGKDIGTAVWQSFYYAAMTFTNTGFVSHVEGLQLFMQDYWLLGLMMVSVFLGSLGFPVFYALAKNLRRHKHWSLHVKLTLTAIVLLFILGGVAFLFLEIGNDKTFDASNPGDYIFQAFYLSMMTRSGGFSMIDPDNLTSSSKLVADMLMFVGGGSASTAGGIKVTTLAVLFLAIVAEARGRDDIEAFGRRVPPDVLRIAVSVLFLSATTIAVASIIIMVSTGFSFENVLFDVISAFGTVGLSTGVAAEAGSIGKVVLIATMWMGRIGTITLAMALSASNKQQFFRRPEERPIVG